MAVVVAEQHAPRAVFGRAGGVGERAAEDHGCAVFPEHLDLRGGKRIEADLRAFRQLLADAVYLNRTDGALIRLTTPLYPGETEQDGDKRLRGFTRELLPQMTRFLPSAAS